jgi:hypothetical protein
MAVRKSTRRTRDQVAADKRAADEALVVQWAETHGAPVSILIGWDPDTGEWSGDSPIGNMLKMIGGATFPTVAARAAGVWQLNELIAKGNEYRADAYENRAYIPIEVRPFIDLVTQIELVESLAEVDLVNTVRRAARLDAKLSLALLGRRFAIRWREQTAIYTPEGEDDRDRAVSEAIAGDPNTANELANLAHRIEDHAQGT